jgi:N-acetyl sugar amidotransferase
VVNPPLQRYCTSCVYPASSAAALEFDEDGVCSGCRVARQRDRIDWDARREELREIFEQYRSKDGSNYDCIIPVSGGKDSHFQTYVVTQEFGLRPLLVTYHGNNYLPVGLRNLRNLRERFGCDHIFFSPSVPVLKKMNRLCFRMMGDMNWHAHCGIFTYPVRVAVDMRIPLIVWGEHGYADLAGMYSLRDRIEMTAKFRLEHAQRGYDWHDMIEETEGLSAQDVIWARYPADEDLARVGVRGIYLQNYVRWEANEHTELMIRDWGFEPSPEPFERTYRLVSNLDDMHENGIHDWLKYVKFGYGRASDHACKDIRAGRMTRDEGIEMVRRYDGVKPRTDLERWLEYVGMTEEEFDETADSFRDPRVWVHDESGNWIKDNIWDFDARRAQAAVEGAA